jgi:hypothetical protein
VLKGRAHSSDGKCRRNDQLLGVDAIAAKLALHVANLAVEVHATLSRIHAIELNEMS